jgi:hypothetical protein
MTLCPACLQVKELEEELATKHKTIDEMAASNADLRRKNKQMKQQHQQQIQLLRNPAKRSADRDALQQQLQQSPSKKHKGGNGNNGGTPTRSPAVLGGTPAQTPAAM